MTPDSSSPTPHRSRSADDELLADYTTPPTLEEAQESHRYWSERRADLPIHKRAERREAEEMTAVWKERLVAAERERYGPKPLDRLLDSLGVRWRPNPKRIVAWLVALLVLGLVLAVVLVVAIVLSWSEIEPIIRTLFDLGGGFADD